MSLSGITIPRKELPIIGSCLAKSCFGSEMDDVGAVRSGDLVIVFPGGMMHERCYRAEPRGPDGCSLDEKGAPA